MSAVKCKIVHVKDYTYKVTDGFCGNVFVVAFLKEQEILKNLLAAHSLSPPSPRPSPPFFLRKNGFKPYNFSSSWLPVTCYGQFALSVCKELNVCMYAT